MRRFWLSLVLCVLTWCVVSAAAPKNISFQAVVRNADGFVVAKSDVGVRVTILRNGNVDVYSETRTAKTNANGLLSFAIGDEDGKSSGSLEDIDWSDGTYFLKCEFDLKGNGDYTISQTTQLLSVPFALYAEKVSPDALPSWVNSSEKPTYDYSEIKNTPKIPTKLSELENDMFFISKGDSSLMPVGIVVSAQDTARWNAKLDSYKESDPEYKQSIAAGITAADTAAWNKKLSEFTESDPEYKQSIAAGITAADTAAWNKKLSEFTESDPEYTKSIAAGITAADTAAWNKKLSNFTESDPEYKQSIAAGITAADTAAWNKKLSDFTESDPEYKQSIAAGITAADTAAWNKKLSNFTESDPEYTKSIAAGITAADTAAWNKK